MADPVVRPVALILITPVLVTLLAVIPIALTLAIVVNSNGFTSEAPVLIEVAPIPDTVNPVALIWLSQPVPMLMAVSVPAPLLV